MQERSGSLCRFHLLPELRAKIESNASLRRSSMVGMDSGGVTPIAKSEAVTQEAVRVASAENTGLSSEQLSVEEGNGVEAPAAVAAEMP